VRDSWFWFKALKALAKGDLSQQNIAENVEKAKIVRRLQGNCHKVKKMGNENAPATLWTGRRRIDSNQTKDKCCQLLLTGVITRYHPSNTQLAIRAYIL
jgi:hypothetical protein